MTSPSKHPLRNLIREIHRRSLWQVLAIYIVGGWVAFEVVQTLTEGLGLPEWFPSFAIVLLIIGLPIVLATAFVQEGVPDSLSADSGSSRTDDHPMDTLAKPSGAHSHRVFTWRNALVGGVGGLALWGVLAAGWILFGGVRGGEVLNATAESASMERSVAVLPFENLSGNPENEYFSDGITEELLNTLAQLPDLRVPGRTSSFAFKGQDLTIQEIADTLHVAHILDGSVRRAGSRVLITAQLVDARTDSHLWSESYERELDDIFAIQREIAQSIAVQLEVRLSGADERALAAGQTGSTEAHDAYLRGRYLWSQRTEETPRNAISEFQRAV
jgi:TolB-like protein